MGEDARLDLGDHVLVVAEGVGGAELSLGDRGFGVGVRADDQSAERAGARPEGHLGGRTPGATWDTRVRDARDAAPAGDLCIKIG